MRKVNIISGQTLADISMREMGSVEAMFDIAELNGMSVSDELMPGAMLLIPDEVADKGVFEFFGAKGIYPAAGLKEAIPAGPAPVILIALPQVAKDELVVIERQTLADLSLQLTGSVEAMFDIAELNDLSVSDVLIPGIKLKVDSEKWKVNSDNKKDIIKEFYEAQQLHPASGWTEWEQEEAEQFTGIDYWAVEVDFVVQ